MKITAWNNGMHNKSGSGYGFKVSKIERDRVFKKEWKSIYLSIPGNINAVEINIDKRSFWNDSCRELINREIGLFFIAYGLTPWPSRKPPKFNLEILVGNHFQLII